jgi:hypothetical protein
MTNLQLESWDYDNLVENKLWNTILNQLNVEGKNKKLKLKRTKNLFESTRINPLNPWLESWDRDNPEKNNSKQIMKPNSQSIKILNNRIEKINQ